MEHNHEDTNKREDLTGEHPIGDIGQIILACIFIAVWILDTFFMKYSIFLNDYIPIWVRIPIGIFLIIISGYLVLKSHAIVFGKVREVPSVIDISVFSVVRHPMYLSELVLYLGLLIFSISLIASVIFCMIFWFLTIIARYEEKLLLKRFGKDYENYMKKISMWLPRIRNK
ncbi:MAG: isoprenylcysteine carboxylmethyltransferase family protein [bacterium]